MLVKLTEDQCRAAIKNGDFLKELCASAPTVVIVLTQSWCPQWTRIRPWLEDFSSEEGARCYFVEYDREPFFDDFMNFKETGFRNGEVPYLRYYRDGVLVKESNYVDKSTFRKLITPAVT